MEPEPCANAAERPSPISPIPLPLTQDPPSSRSSPHPQRAFHTPPQAQEVEQKSQHLAPASDYTPAHATEAHAYPSESGSVATQRQRVDTSAPSPRRNSATPPTSAPTPGDSEMSAPVLSESSPDSPPGYSVWPLDPDAKQSSACTPTVQVHERYGPPPDESNEIDVHCDSPSEPATDGSNHLPLERFASKKSPEGLDCIPALFTPENEDTLVSLFETHQPTWDTSKNRHLRPFGYTMGANGNNIHHKTCPPTLSLSLSGWLTIWLLGAFLLTYQTS